MRSLRAFSLDRMDEHARYLDPVAALGVTEVRYLAAPTRDIEELVYTVPIGTPKERVVEVVRRARDACAPLPCSVNEDGTGVCLWEPGLTAKLARTGRTLAEHWNVPPDLVAGL
jgi:hypothetical protein